MSGEDRTEELRAHRLRVVARLTQVLGEECPEVGADSLRAYAVDAEQSVYLANACDPASYGYCEEVYDLLSKLSANGGHIVRTVAAAGVRAAPWRQLCAGLPVIREEEESALAAGRFNELLAQNVESVKTSAAHTHSVVCSKCGSSDVAVMLRQTRSADEGMSSFANCRKCGARWRMS